MKWYAAHAIMYVKFRDANQDKYPIWENIILIQASSNDEAWEKAKIRAKEDEDDESSENTWENRPAIFLLAGIRKIVLCMDEENEPTDGTEISYSQMELDSWDSLLKFLKGEMISIKYHY
ncbi:DUF4288 domain-containing protein [Pseudanabaena sp. UWO310]|uniref:DUF4288 domain-containing protein n=1 Tax=Pseudanabaena sp. UWO310 TaxID=2480795 RepID=UPI001159C190|nr:DUF4288 domain-containing protein [Pseudanabaena sp. UWO310]TYQ30552.1 DUF4288 domain-containing protein [Pseudanabaena sp. UWO310]